MKKLILIALASLSFISCRKDDDEKDEAMIVGTWNLNKIQIVSGKDSSVLNSEVISDCPDKRTYLFSDHSYTLTIFKDNFIGSCVPDETENGEFNYNVDQKKITFKSTLTQNPYIMNVNSITHNELQLIDSFFGYDANNDGIIDKRILVFSK
ncbi:lipocalin family protein [Epilithonimonas sp. JDS]|uniref:lipocalin family protein n=1 Tax=Epilithonimonas sp. JDS TaxID=2902797 RepID=UPI001E5995DA|nr:lipocalin family protein [Epilithonimonas sp. JDS]MCD9853153.1 lipocalin family protein [Epilithonimonas sp. JDS]